MADQDTLKEFPLLIRIKDQSRGLNTRSFPTEISDNEAQELNDLFSDPGLVKKREGTTTFSTATGASGAVRAAADFKPDDGSGQVLMQAIENEIYSIDSSGVSAVRATVATSDVEGEFVQGLNKMFFSNGTDRPIVFDTALTFSTIASAASAIPIHTTSEYYLNRIWTNDVDNKSFLHYSTTLGTIFDRTAQVFKFAEGSGNSEIVKVVGYRIQELLVFMSNRIEQLQVVNPADDTTWVRRVIDTRYGLAAKDTVKEIGGSIYFLDNERNVRILNRTALDAPTGTQALPISDRIESEMDRINRLHISKASAGVHENFYLLSLPLDDNTENSHIFVFDTRQAAWYGPWDLSAAKLVESDIRAQGRDTYFGNTTDGKMIRMFDGTLDDDGESIGTSLTTKKYDFNRPESDKIFNEIEVGVLGTGSGTVTVSARVDQAGFTVVGTFEITGGGPVLPEDLPFDLGSAGIVRAKFHLEQFSRGRNIDFKFEHDETTDVRYLEWIITVQDQNYSRENI